MFVNDPHALERVALSCLGRPLTRGRARRSSNPSPWEGCREALTSSVARHLRRSPRIHGSERALTGAGGPGHSRALRQDRAHGADARRREAVHDRLRAEGPGDRRTRSCCTGRRTDRRRTGRTAIGRRSVRRRRSPRERFIFVYQDVRGKFRSEGEFVVMRPIKPRAEARRRPPTRAPTPTTRSTGW